MEANNIVTIPMLRHVINTIFDFIENDLKCSNVELAHDDYWAVKRSAMFLLNGDSESVVCRSLADDWMFVQSAYNSPEQAVPITFHHVAPLLQALATMLPSYIPNKGNDRHEASGPSDQA